MVTPRFIAAASACALALAACGNGAQVPAPLSPGLTGSAAASPAVAALEAAAQAYAQENLKPLSDMLPARFIGRSALLDGAARAIAEDKKIELRLLDVRVQPSASPDGPVAVTARWEKRFLKLPGLTPVAESGMLAAVLVRSGGRWFIESLNADNPFSR